MDHDLGPGRPARRGRRVRRLLLHVDGWLCEIKDAQIRDGLHVLGQAPDRRGPGQPGAGDPAGPRRCGAASRTRCPACAQALGLAEDGTTTGPPSTTPRRGPGRWSRRWRTPAGTPTAVAGADRRTARRSASRMLRFAATEVVPRLAGTTDELDHGAARPGRRLRRRPGRRARRCAGWSTCCRPAATSTPSTRRRCRPGWPGRPVRRWPIRCSSATAPTPASYPQSVGLSVWGTSAMRTSGDDIAEVLALLGVRPVWDEASRRVIGLEPIAAGRAGPAAHRRHGADLRLLPRRLPARGRDARRRGAAGRRASTSRPSTTTSAPTRRPTSPSTATERRATTRIFGSKPGAYGAGLLPLIDSRQLARRRRPRRGLHGVGRLRLRPRPRRRARPPTTWTAHYRRIAVAAKNTDTREHDIADSDDYFQYHGGMVATVRALTGTRPGGLHRRLHPARTRSAPAR